MKKTKKTFFVRICIGKNNNGINFKIKSLIKQNVKEIWTNNGSGIKTCGILMSYKRFLFLTRCNNVR